MSIDIEKISDQPYPNAVVDKINEIVDKIGEVSTDLENKIIKASPTISTAVNGYMFLNKNLLMQWGTWLKGSSDVPRIYFQFTYDTLFNVQATNLKYGNGSATLNINEFENDHFFAQGAGQGGSGWTDYHNFMWLAIGTISEESYNSQLAAITEYSNTFYNLVIDAVDTQYVKKYSVTFTEGRYGSAPSNITDATGQTSISCRYGTGWKITWTNKSNEYYGDLSSQSGTMTGDTTVTWNNTYEPYDNSGGGDGGE